MDFDSPAAAQKAVTALKSSGVQAQMAKVRLEASLCAFFKYLLPTHDLHITSLFSKVL